MSRSKISRSTLARATLLTLAAGLLASSLVAAPDPSGHWEGQLEVPGSPIAMHLDLAQRAGGDWRGTLSVPAQGMTGFPLSDLRVDGATVAFAMTGVPGAPSFKGTHDSAGKLKGTFSQSGQALPLGFERTGDAQLGAASEAKAVPAATARALVGDWSGALTAPTGQKMRIVFHVTAREDGTLAATLDSPDQGQAGVPVSAVNVDGDDVRFELSYVKVEATGTLNADRSAITGEWKQGPATLPLELKKSGAGAATPQTTPARY